MAEVIIHIGTHKTGTTAIQNFLRINQQKLKEQNVIYLECESNPIIHSIRSEKEEDKKAFTNWVKSSIDKNSNAKYILSWEEFSGYAYSGYGNAKYIANLLGEVFKGYDTKIVAYFRRQDDFIESLYTQSIHEGRDHSFDAFLETLNKEENLFEWDKFLENYLEYFKKESLIVRLYEKEKFKNSNLIEDFCSAIKIDYSKLTEIPKDRKQNPGYSRQALEFAKICNSFLERNDKNLLRLLLQSTNSKEKFEKYSIFTNKQRKELLDRYEQSNNNLSEKYLDGVSFCEPIFTDENLDESNHEITLKDSIEVFSKIILSMKKQESALTNEVLRLKENEKVFANTIGNLQKQNADIINVINQLVNPK